MSMHDTQEIQKIVGGYIGEFIGLDSISGEINVFEEGLVDSLFAIELMTFLESAFHIKIGMGDLDMTYFESINNITAFVLKKEAESA